MKKIENFVHVLSRIVCVCLTLDCCVAWSPRAPIVGPILGRRYVHVILTNQSIQSSYCILSLAHVLATLSCTSGSHWLINEISLLSLQ